MKAFTPGFVLKLSQDNFHSCLSCILLQLTVLSLMSGTQIDGDGDRSVNGTYTGSIVNGVAGGKYRCINSFLKLFIRCLPSINC